MQKSDIIIAVARAAGLSESQASAAVRTVFSSIQDSVVGGQKVTVMGFGTFEPIVRKPKRGVHPRTGEPIQIPARKAVRFNVGKKLREAVEQG